MPSFLKVPKVRSEPYRRYIASLPCYRCGVHGYSQAAHADEGKGIGLKTDDLTCYPLCGPRLRDPGCHEIVGRSMDRDYRRVYEQEGAAWAKAELIRQSQEDRKLRELLLKLGVLNPTRSATQSRP